jgi:hypothetical protein
MAWHIEHIFLTLRCMARDMKIEPAELVEWETQFVAGVGPRP